MAGTYRVLCKEQSLQQVGSIHGKGVSHFLILSSTGGQSGVLDSDSGHLLAASLRAPLHVAVPLPVSTSASLGSHPALDASLSDNPSPSLFCCGIASWLPALVSGVSTLGSLDLQDLAEVSRGLPPLLPTEQFYVLELLLRLHLNKSLCA